MGLRPSFPISCFRVVHATWCPVQCAQRWRQQHHQWRSVDCKDEDGGRRNEFDADVVVTCCSCSDVTVSFVWARSSLHGPRSDVLLLPAPLFGHLFHRTGQQPNDTKDHAIVRGWDLCIVSHVDSFGDFVSASTSRRTCCVTWTVLVIFKSDDSFRSRAAVLVDVSRPWR